jgi:hypothetical protein
MAARERYFQKPQADIPVMPFGSVEEAWFWFIQAQQARNDGARFSMGQGLVPRPCEPLDILKVIDGLYRQRRLVMDHMMVLRHYGRRMMPPDARRVKEAVAAKLWGEAMDRMEPVLIRKGIVGSMQYMEAAE